MKMELMYFFQARLVRVTRKATMPPKMMETTQVPTARYSVFSSGVSRNFLKTILFVNRSTKLAKE